jgi:membrane protein YqaA with SNARE-associated domain
MDTLLLYLQVFFEAAWLASLIPMGNDTAFYAMHFFGGYSMPPAVLMAIIGATLGQMLNYYLGRGLQNLKYTRNMTLSEDVYVRFEYYFNRYAIYVLVLSWAPLCKLLPLLAGFSNAPRLKVLALIVVGYIYHYGKTLVL